MLSRQRGTDSLNVLEAGERGAPAASDVSIIPGGTGTRLRLCGGSEREPRCRAIDRPGDHAHPGETRRADAPSENRTPARADAAAGSAAPPRFQGYPTYLHLTSFPQLHASPPVSRRPYEYDLAVSRLGRDMKIYKAG